jgi:iron complex transport system permease protein
MRSRVLTRKKYLIILLPFVLLFLLSLVICPLIGSERISLAKALDSTKPMRENPDAVILFYARIPRCLLALLVGAALASAGVTFQAMLKNPLATPYTLGLAGGSSLAAVTVIMFFDWIKWQFPLLQPIASFIGALITLGIVFRLGRRSGGFQHVTLILAGVTLNLFFSSLIMLMQYIADPARTFFILHWLMGNLDFIRYDPILLILPFQITGMAILFYHARAMNLLSLDEMSARSLGLDVPVVMRRLYIASALVAGSAIAFSGPIGFVGLIVPHAIRLMVGADHRILLPTSFLAGGAFLILCDTLARTVLAPTELPVGVITALLGGPFFLWLLLRQKKGGMEI